MKTANLEIAKYNAAVNQFKIDDHNEVQKEVFKDAFVEE
jgi:23S rRNA G2069 N7-methylase RlmK/C1962 C5-methylase RlmI